MSHLPQHERGYRASLMLTLALVVASVLAAAERRDTHHVKAVRFWSLGDVTRIVVETDGSFQLRSDHLENPERLFFDLEGTAPSLGQKPIAVISVTDGLVRQIRVAETQRNVTRVVLDMEEPAVVSTSRLDNPNRLIIELRAKTAESISKTPVRNSPLEAGTVVPKEAAPLKEVADEPAAPREPIAAKPVEHRKFSPPPAARPAGSKPVQVALLDPPLVQATQPGAGSSNMASRLALSSYPNAPAPPKSSATAISPATPVAENVGASKPEVPLPAKRNSAGGRSMIRVLGLKVGRIVLDPGHGGHDTGTIGPEGLREKDLVLDVAKRLGALIEDRLGSEVIYTRTDDTFVALERRTEIANEAKADLFLSIHANSSTLRSAAGVETYYLNFTTSRAALEVAARENAGSQKTIYELQDLLEKIALKDKVEESREFAARVQNALFALSAKSDSLARDHRGVKRAPFVVLIGASMPSVLSEIGFISNAHDESIMKRPEYRQRIAEALYKGVSSYANTLSHFQVAQRQ